MRTTLTCNLFFFLFLFLDLFSDRWGFSLPSRSTFPNQLVHKTRVVRIIGNVIYTRRWHVINALSISLPHINTRFSHVANLKVDTIPALSEVCDRKLYLTSTKVRKWRSYEKSCDFCFVCQHRMWKWFLAAFETRTRYLKSRNRTVLVLAQPIYPF